MKTHLRSALLIGLLGVGGILYHFLGTSETELPLIAVTQIVEHPSLDEERVAMVQQLETLGWKDGKTVRIEFQNAQGNIAMATQIAARFATEKPAVMVAISTPSAQAALPTCLQHKIPLLFSSVTDPLGAKLVASLEKREDAVAGISDYLDATSQVHFLQKIMPSLKRIGVLYNPGEANSVKSVTEFKAIAEKEGFIVIEGTATRTSDVPLTVNTLVPQVEAFYVPNDNMFVSSMRSIVQIAHPQHKPVFAGDKGSVEQGACAAYAYDRSVLGKALGDLAHLVLKGKHAGDFVINQGHPLTVYMHEESAKTLGIEIPQGAKTIH